MRRPSLLASLGIVLAVSTARPMDAQTCTRPACIGPFATPDALSSAALREARARSWRMAHRAGAAPRSGGRARWALPPTTLVGASAARVGVLALEGLPGPRRPGASAWVAFERPEGWHACEGASRGGTRGPVRVDADAPETTQLFEQGPAGLTVALHFSEDWRARAYDHSAWHEHLVACGLDGDAPSCFGSIEIEAGSSESDGEGSERTVERVRARFDGQGHVDVEAGFGQETIPAGEPSIFDQVGHHDVRSLGCGASAD